MDAERTDANKDVDLLLIEGEKLDDLHLVRIERIINVTNG